MANFAVVGNQIGWTYEEVKNILDGIFLKDLPERIVSGGAIGVDEFAQQYAKEKGCQLPPPKILTDF